MEKLKLVIGPAPHEMPYDDLVRRLIDERERINKVLFSPKPVKKVVTKVKAKSKPKPKKTITQKQAEDILRRLAL